MEELLVLLILGLLIALILGLVNPSLILFWSKKPTPLKVLGWWGLTTVIIIIVFNALKPEKTTEEIINDSKSKKEEITETVTPKDPEVEKQKTKDQLIREIESIDKGIDFSTYHYSSNVKDLQMVLVVFGVWANIILEAEQSEDTEIQQLAKKLKTKVANVQIKEFPILREKYASILAQTMWEHDVYISVSGTGNKCINITGGIFAANKNKQDFHYALKKVLTEFRFYESRYRWYKGEYEYDSWTMFHGKDSDLVRFTR